MGLVAAEADSPSALWENVLTARSPAQWWPPDENRPGMAVCRVESSLERAGVRLRREHRKDRCTKLALLAAARAWDAAELGPTASEPPRCGVMVGTSRGPVATTLATIQPPTGHSRLLPSTAAESTFACLHGSIAPLFNLQGPCLTVTTACSSGGHALALAADQLILGRADLMLVGGADAPLLPCLADSFLAAGILDLRELKDFPCRPFAEGANGTILGEGAAFLVLEKKSSAHKRGAPICARLGGWAVAADGWNTSAESGGDQALAHATTLALTQAGLGPDEVGYINAHGTGTARNDEIELQWWREFMAGQDLGRRLGSTKAVTGHCLGAGAILEAIIAIQALHAGIAPPSAHCQPPLADFADNLLCQGPEALAAPWVMSNSLGFWGTASSFLFTTA
jgi:3-oxoacyl-(acyl-carrier-protein) synthase